MFTLFGRRYRHCDGLSRRAFLTAGAVGLGGLTLADLLRAEAAAGIKSSTKSIINIHLDGGPPQLDTIDPKPDAPVEIRGEFRPIATKIPGVQLCELLPKVASIADKGTIFCSPCSSCVFIFISPDKKHASLISFPAFP